MISADKQIAEWLRWELGAPTLQQALHSRYILQMFFTEQTHGSDINKCVNLVCSSCYRSEEEQWRTWQMNAHFNNERMMNERTGSECCRKHCLWKHSVLHISPFKALLFNSAAEMLMYFCFTFCTWHNQYLFLCKAPPLLFPVNSLVTLVSLTLYLD